MTSRPQACSNYTSITSMKHFSSKETFLCFKKQENRIGRRKSEIRDESGCGKRQYQRRHPANLLFQIPNKSDACLQLHFVYCGQGFLVIGG